MGLSQNAAQFMYPWGVSGQYYWAGANAADTNPLLAVVNKLNTAPLIFRKGVTINRIACRVTTGAGAGGVVRIGLYADNGSTFPGALIEGSGELVTTATGLLTYDLLTPLVVGANQIIWLSSLFGVAAPSCRSVTTNAGLGMFGSNLMLDDMCSTIQSDLAYAALPATHPAVTTYIPDGLFVAARLA